MVNKCTCCGDLIRGKEYTIGPNGTTFCDPCLQKIGLLVNNRNYGSTKVVENIYKKDSSGFEGVTQKVPTEIKKELDKYVIGQEDAKQVMAVAAYNHYKRVHLNKTTEDETIEKSNILMIGPTGSGKTHMIKSLAKVLDVPFAIADATTLTEAGYVGSDVESIVVSLLHAAGDNVDRAATGIVFIDEIDKLAQNGNGKEKRVVGGEGVQQALLKIIEGTKISVPVGAKGNNSLRKEVTIDTTDILFICGGAFPAIEPIIKKRMEQKEKNIGITEFLLSNIEDEDLSEFGLIPEFIGRLPVVTTLEDVSLEMFERILVEPKNAILTQYQRSFAYDGVELTFSKEAIHLIAENAAVRKRGARALRSEVERLLKNLMFEIPGSFVGGIRITGDFVKGLGKPIYIKKH